MENDSKQGIFRISEGDRERLAARLAEILAPLEELSRDAARVVVKHRRGVEWGGR